MMVECGGLAQVINTLANINIELKEHQQYIDAKKRGLQFEHNPSEIVANQKAQGMYVVIISRAMHILHRLMENEQAKKFIIDSNVVAPIMNLIHSGAREIMHDWFDVFSKFLDIPEFLIQFQNLENLDLFFLRTIKNTPFEPSKDLITLLQKFCTIQ